MKIIVTAESYRFGEFARSAPKEGQSPVGHFMRLNGKSPAGRKQAPIVLWDADAVALDADIRRLIPEGVDLVDMRLALEFEGEERAVERRKRDVGTFKERVFQVARNGFRVLTGPAQELHRARISAAGAYERATEIAAGGDFRAAYQALRVHLAGFARIDIPSDDETAEISEAVATGASADVPAAEAPVEGVSPEAGGAAVDAPQPPVVDVVVEGVVSAPVASEESPGQGEEAPAEPEVAALPVADTVASDGQVEDDVQALSVLSPADEQPIAVVEDVRAEDAPPADEAGVVEVSDETVEAVPAPEPIVAEEAAAPAEAPVVETDATGAEDAANVQANPSVEGSVHAVEQKAPTAPAPVVQPARVATRPVMGFGRPIARPGAQAPARAASQQPASVQPAPARPAAPLQSKAATVAQAPVSLPTESPEAAAEGAWQVGGARTDFTPEAAVPEPVGAETAAPAVVQTDGAVRSVGRRSTLSGSEPPPPSVRPAPPPPKVHRRPIGAIGGGFGARRR
jgi:hypothetical protein